MMRTNIGRRAIKRLSRYFLRESRKTVAHAHINDFDLLVLANEEVGRAIYFGRNYETPETKYLERTITASSVCVDVGANVGYFSLLMAKAAYNGKVYSFEPIPLNAALIRASAELNGYKNIEVIESALGDREGEVDLTQSSDTAYSSMSDTSRKGVDRVIRVPITTLDAFVRERRIRSIDVLKIDVEGAEDLVINGSQQLLSDAAIRPQTIIMEVFESNLGVYNTSAREIIGKMRGFGYTPYFIDDRFMPVAFVEGGLEKKYNVLFAGLRTEK